MEQENLLSQIEGKRCEQFQQLPVFRVPNIFDIDFNDFFNDMPLAKELSQDRKYNWAIQQPGTQQPRAPMALSVYLYSQTPKQAFESLLITADPTMDNPECFNLHSSLIAISEVEDDKLKSLN